MQLFLHKWQIRTSSFLCDGCTFCGWLDNIHSLAMCCRRTGQLISILIVIDRVPHLSWPSGDYHYPCCFILFQFLETLWNHTKRGKNNHLVHSTQQRMHLLSIFQGQVCRKYNYLGNCLLSLDANMSKSGCGLAACQGLYLREWSSACTQYWCLFPLTVYQQPHYISLQYVLQKSRCF